MIVDRLQQIFGTTLEASVFTLWAVFIAALMLSLQKEIERRSAESVAVIAPSLPPETKKKKQKQRFKKMATKVMMNLLWREDLRLKHGTREEPFVVKMGSGPTMEIISFDINDFRVTRSHGGSSGGGLSHKCLLILGMEPCYRTEAQLRYLKVCSTRYSSVKWHRYRSMGHHMWHEVQTFKVSMYRLTSHDWMVKS